MCYVAVFLCISLCGVLLCLWCILFLVFCVAMSFLSSVLWVSCVVLLWVSCLVCCYRLLVWCCCGFLVWCVAIGFLCGVAMGFLFGVLL